MDQYYNDLFDNDRIDLKTASFDWQTKAVAIDNTLLKPRGYDHIAGTNWSTLASEMKTAVDFLRKNLTVFGRNSLSRWALKDPRAMSSKVLYMRY